MSSQSNPAEADTAGSCRGEFAPRSGHDLGIVVVGAAGHQGRMYTEILHAHGYLITGLVDVNVASISPLPGVPVYACLEDALAGEHFDVALVAVPHNEHFSTVKRLLESGKHVVKEKPFVFSALEMATYLSLCRRHGLGLRVISPRSYWLSVRVARELLGELGSLLSFSYRYSLNLTGRTTGWRAVRQFGLGGVILDMGYHAADVIHRLFGMPRRATTARTYCYPETASEGLEDVAQILLEGFPAHGLFGHVSLARHDTVREERLEVLGTQGKLVILPECVTLLKRTGATSYECAIPGADKAAEELMLLDAVDRITERAVIREELVRQALVSRLVEMFNGGDARVATPDCPVMTFPRKSPNRVALTRAGRV